MNLFLQSLSLVANEVTSVLLKSGLAFLHSIIVVSIFLLVFGNICTIRLVFCSFASISTSNALVGVVLITKILSLQRWVAA